MSAGLGVFLVWFAGAALSMLVLGVLYHKGIIDWRPEGGSRNSYHDDIPPHAVPCLFWFIVVPLTIAGFTLYWIWHGINNFAKFLARISWEKEE